MHNLHVLLLFYHGFSKFAVGPSLLGALHCKAIMTVNIIVFYW